MIEHIAPRIPAFDFRCWARGPRYCEREPFDLPTCSRAFISIALASSPDGHGGLTAWPVQRLGAVEIQMGCRRWRWHRGLHENRHRVSGLQRWER